MAEPILKLDKYMLIESVGQGGMATVYKARIVGPMGFEKMAAVKLLHAELGSDPEVVRMFIDEARIGGQLSHPNVVNILGFRADRQSIFHRHGIRRRMLSVPTDSARQIAQGDAAADRGRGLRHRRSAGGA